MMESGFIGLIFSCFNNDQASQGGRIQLLAFQANDNKEKRVGGAVAAADVSNVVRWEQINIPISIVQS